MRVVLSFVYILLSFGFSFGQIPDLDKAILDYYEDRIGLSNIGFSYVFPNNIFKDVRDDIFEYKTVVFSRNDSIDVLPEFKEDWYLFEYDFNHFLSKAVENKDKVWDFEGYNINLLSESKFDDFLRENKGNVVIILTQPVELKDDIFSMIELMVLGEYDIVIKWKLLNYTNGELRDFATIKEYEY